MKLRPREVKGLLQITGAQQVHLDSLLCLSVSSCLKTQVRALGELSSQVYFSGSPSLGDIHSPEDSRQALLYGIIAMALPRGSQSRRA